MINVSTKNYLSAGIIQPKFEQGLAQSKAVNAQKSDAQADNLAGLSDVADQFEAIFLETLLRQARESKLSEGLFESKADDNFEQMFDQELANSTSKLVDIGIAEAIVRQMSKG
jgi:flagellar protein FlgJ